MFNKNLTSIYWTTILEKRLEIVYLGSSDKPSEFCAQLLKRAGGGLGFQLSAGNLMLSFVGCPEA